jgi:hypothetical protein
MKVCNLFQNLSFGYHYFPTKRPHVGSTTVQFSLFVLILSGFHHPSRRVNKHQDIIMFSWRVNSVTSYHIGSFWYNKMCILLYGLVGWRRHLPTGHDWYHGDLHHHRNQEKWITLYHENIQWIRDSFGIYFKLLVS